MTTESRRELLDTLRPKRAGRVSWPLLLIAVFMAPVGLQAALMPRSFFDDFPLGRGWITATDGAYNEHLVRDVGGLFVALVVATVWVAVTRRGEAAIAVAWVVQGVGHVLFHGAHLHGLSTADRVGLIGSLAVIPVLAALALYLSWAARLDHDASPERP